MADYIPSKDAQAVPNRVRELCSINQNVWTPLVEKGTFKDCTTYQDYFTAVINHYRTSSEAKEAAAKARLLEQESKPKYKDEGLRNQLDQVTIAEKIQKIRLDKAREQELWTKNSVARNELVQKTELEQLLFPFFTTMVNILRHAADTNPALVEPIDNCINELFTIGERLETQAIGDSKKYVQVMLDTSLNYMELLENFEEIS